MNTFNRFFFVLLASYIIGLSASCTPNNIVLEPTQTTIPTTELAMTTEQKPPPPTLALTLTEPVATMTESPAAPSQTPSAVVISPTISQETVTPIVTSTNIPVNTPTQLPATATTMPELQATSTLTSTYHYVFPIQPSSEAYYQDGHHDYPATDIVNYNCGANFVAVTDGIINDVSYDDLWEPTTNDPAQRSGLFVSLIGDDGIRYYGSHLQTVAEDINVGDRVTVGHILGTVGNSGNARGLACHVHFGISQPTFAGDWAVRRGQVSPFPYLQAWERGENLTPVLPAAE